MPPTSEEHIQQREAMVNKEDNVFRAERDLKGLKAKVQDSRFRFVT